MSDIKRVWANPESLWSEGRVKFVEGVELVYASDYDDAQTELAALREELADTKSDIDTIAEHNIHLMESLTAAEQRNAELVGLLGDCKERLSRVRFIGLHRRINAVLSPAIKEPVKTQAVDCGQCPYITDGCQDTCEKSRPAFWNKPTESGASE